MLARLIAFLLWGLLALSAGYWLIQLMAKPLTTPAQALTALDRQSPQGDLTRLFGAATTAAPEAEAAPAESRFQLLGVVAPKGVKGPHAGEGVALIAVDGVARTVRVGALVDGGLRLLSVEARSASLGEAGGRTFSLQMAPLTPAATGALPPAQPSPVVLGGALPQAAQATAQDAPYSNVPPAMPLNDPSGPPAR
ncbi:hypothetical protein [Roseateles sp.]|uniref:hypothetical protein n=1 Tax=Roseateles sp. TaxID=1971397 RepID=UPI003BA49F0E